MENFTEAQNISQDHSSFFFSSRGGLFCQDGWLSSKLIGDSFLWTWLILSFVSFVICMTLSGVLFYLYYWPSNITYEKWQRKSNPKYPSPEKVRDEIVQMCKAFLCSNVCPAVSIYSAAHQGNDGSSDTSGFHITTKAYCGPAPSPWYHVAEFIGIMLVSDFFEFFYHYCGHTFKSLWSQHRHHHKFFNPSPFSVIADEFVDQFVRASPLLLFPLLVPINMDLMFFEFGTFFYFYGVYLHWGYEMDWPDAHHPILNTSFQHYCHHAKGVIGKPTHCGFFFKIWDQLFRCTYEGKCFCAKCERRKGNRTKEQFELVHIPDHSKLLRPSFWIQAKVLTGTTSKDSNDDTTDGENNDAVKRKGE